jgi:hypothetical protein
MTERERLIELLKASDEDSARRCITDYNEAISDNADYLLSNGVIVPPCKVGDTVYVLIGEPSRAVKEFRVRTIVFNETHDSIGFTNKSMFTIWDKRWYDFFGKIIFTSREEAEEALEGKT